MSPPRGSEPRERRESLASAAERWLAQGDAREAPAVRAECYARAADLLSGAALLLAAEVCCALAPLRALGMLRQLEGLTRGELRGSERGRALRCAARAYADLGEPALAAAFAHAARPTRLLQRPTALWATAS